MKVCILTPRLFVIVREASSLRGTDGEIDDAKIAPIVAGYESNLFRTEPDYVYLFDRYRSFRLWFCHHVLRTMVKLPWLPGVLASAALRLAAREIGNTLRGCNPSVVRGFGLPWNRQLVRFLRRRHPEWVADSATVRYKARGPTAESSEKVSIVLPTYNGVRYLRQAIESCLGQTHSNLELIVVDDGSEPEVRAIVQEYRSDPRLRYERHEGNRGVAESLNTGFRLSTGSYLSWTSDDNYYETFAMRELAGFLDRYPDVDFVYAESHEVDEHGLVTRLLRPGPPSSLRFNNTIGACFLYRRRVYERVGDYRPVFLTEDYDYWIRVARTCRMQRLFTPLYFYRAHPASLTGRHSRDERIQQINRAKQMNRFGSRRNC